MKNSAKPVILAVLFFLFSCTLYLNYRISLFQDLKSSVENDLEKWLKEFRLENYIPLLKEKGKNIF